MTMGTLDLVTLTAGSERNHAYLVADAATATAVVIDPAGSQAGLLAAAQARAWRIERILLTHSHHDHRAGAEILAQACMAPVLGQGDSDPATGIRLEHQAVLPLGTLEIHVLHAPGHSHDSLCYLICDHLFSGDTLFVDWVGHAWSDDDAAILHDSLHRIVLALDDATQVLPGHDYGCEPRSTIGTERHRNPFLRLDRTSFIERLRRERGG